MGLGDDKTKSIIHVYTESPLGLLSLGLIMLAVIYSIKNWKCPACNTYLGKKAYHYSFCRSCGVKLQ